MHPACSIRRTEANASKSARFAVTSGWSSKNGTTTETKSLLRFTEKRSSAWRWLSWRRFSMICPHPNTCWRSSSAGLDGAAWVTENSCWTCQPRRHPGFARPRSRSSLRRQRSRRPTARALAFPADCPHRSDCHCAWPHPTARVGQGSTAGCSGFPAYSRLHSARRRAEGQTRCTSGLLP
jgi:hypothetical protein